MKSKLDNLIRGMRRSFLQLLFSLFNHQNCSTNEISIALLTAVIIIGAEIQVSGKIKFEFIIQNY